MPSKNLQNEKMIFLSKFSIKTIHESQIIQHGGTPGLRDENLLESAIAMPESGMGENYFHSNIFEMAAAYAYHIIKSHPFIDGNKRTGMAAALIFLDVNNIHVNLPVHLVVFIGQQIASSKLSKKDTAKLFKKNIKSLRKLI